MTYRHGLTLALALVTAPPVLAQSPTATAALRYEVGVGISPFFMPFLDESGSFPPSGWVTVPTGRFRLQLDYLRDVRSQSLYYAGYYDTDEQGRDFSYDRARMDHHVDQVFGAAVLWPFPRDSTTTYLLIGGAYQHTADRWCVAEGEPEPRGRLDFPAGFDCSRAGALAGLIEALAQLLPGLTAALGRDEAGARPPPSRSAPGECPVAMPFGRDEAGARPPPSRSAPGECPVAMPFPTTTGSPHSVRHCRPNRATRVRLAARRQSARNSSFRRENRAVRARSRCPAHRRDSPTCGPRRHPAERPSRWRA